MTKCSPELIARNGLHKRLRRARGDAFMLDCVDCGEMARDWSWVHDTDPADFSNYVPRCRSCHKKYDYVPEIHVKMRETNPNYGDKIGAANSLRRAQ